MLHFPTQTETIVNFLTKNAEDIHPVIDFKISLPEEQWGKKDPDGNDMPEVKAHRSSFIHLLAERYEKACM